MEKFPLPKTSHHQRSKAGWKNLVDVGLLTAMGDLDSKTLLDGNTIFSEFKGALTEQFVAQQLISDCNLVIYYWTAERSSAEIDFLVQSGNSVIPVEVKAAENLQAKSLKFFSQKFNPIISVRTSMSDYRNQEWLINLPLYAISMMNTIGDAALDEGAGMAKL